MVAFVFLCVVLVILAGGLAASFRVAATTKDDDVSVGAGMLGIVLIIALLLVTGVAYDRAKVLDGDKPAEASK